MVSVTSRYPKDSPICCIACDIVDYVLSRPSTFLFFSEVVCTAQTTDEVEERARIYLESPAEVTKSEAEHLKGLIVDYYKVKARRWDIDARRGLLLEELVYRLDPKHLGLASSANAERIRTAVFLVDKRPIADNDLDVVFLEKDKGDGVECKTNLGTWLSHEKPPKRKVKRKLDYMVAVRTLSSERTVHQWLGTLQSDPWFAREVLDRHGYQCICVFGRRELHAAVHSRVCA